MPEQAVVQVDGLHETSARLRGFARRMVLPQPALEAAIRLLGESESQIFDAWGGEFVRTGATRASLTSDAAGAVRRSRGQTLEFGTSIWYARFQRRIDGPSGRPRGRKRVGRSLIVKAPTAVRRAVRQTVLDYIRY